MDKSEQSSAQDEPFGYWVEQRLADPVLLRKPAYIPKPTNDRTVTPLYAAPQSSEREVKLTAALEAIKYEAERENGGWAHLKRCIAVQTRQALGSGHD